MRAKLLADVPPSIQVKTVRRKNIPGPYTIPVYYVLKL
jgi:hypothetical protein